MWRWFWFRTEGVEGQSATYAAEVLEAGWIPPLPSPSASAVEAPGSSESASDVTAFLARVYRNQEC